MPALDPAALQPVQNLLRQLRDLKGVREVRPGVFQLRGATLAQFLPGEAGLEAELRKPGGSGFDRYPVHTPPQQRKFLEDARLRASRLDED